MITYNAALPVLSTLEQDWFTRFATRFGATPPVNPIPEASLSAPHPNVVNGEVQFFSIEYVKSETNPIKCFSMEEAFGELGLGLIETLKSASVPLIIAVGINYGQDPTTYPFPTHHLHRRSAGKTWVEDYSTPDMRNALNVALDLYRKNEATWIKNRYASGPVPANLSVVTDYILIATNLSPFLTQQCWTNHYPPGHKSPKPNLLDAWDQNQHLCDLIRKLGQFVDLWVVHGTDAVWPTFLQNSCIKDWILTPNLSRQPVNTGHMGRFWGNPPGINPGGPQWPIC